MKQKTNTNNEQILEDQANAYLVRDVKHSVLIVSLVANLSLFTLWVALLVTERYDASLASFFFNR